MLDREKQAKIVIILYISKEEPFMAQDLEARVKELETKVQELTDREAIRDLRYRYHEYVKQSGQWKFKKMGLIPYFMVPLREGWAQEDRVKMGR
jgi:hypothetical protein